MDIRQLEYFIAIVERGSYVRAAEALGVTQSALTQAIGRLEQRVRSKLIDRKRSGAVVTEAGRMLLPRAKLILSEARLAESELQTTKSSTTPRIVLGVGKSVPYDIIPSAIAVLLAKDPDVGITVVEGWSPDLFRQLGEGDLDFVVSAPLPQVGVDLAL